MTARVLLISFCCVLTEVAATHSESPQFAEMVRQGKLPPLEERLPADPLVVKPYEELGRYGGTWHRLMLGTSDIHCYTRTTYDQILRWAPDLRDGVIPNLAAKYAFSEGYRVLTLTLRRGLKWSDGHPFTTDDVLFWWQRIANDPNITPTVPKYWCPGGKPMEVRKLDDVTIEFRFAKPYPLAAKVLAFKGNQWPLAFERFGAFAPKHYLEPCLAKGYQLFEEKAHDLNVDRPVMTAWKPAEWKPGSRLVAGRNPYYWKVDPQGKQLPYIDRVELEICFNKQMVLLRGISGQVEMQLRHFTPEDTELLNDFASKGGYRVMRYEGTGGQAILLNLEYPGDPLLRALFQDVRFRRALTLAIDRKLIRTLVYKGRVKPPAFNFSDRSPYHVEEQKLPDYLGHDPKRASALLDEMGLTKRDAAGHRLLSDGRAISIIVETTQLAEALEIVRDNWSTVGIKASIKPEDRTLFMQRVRRNGDHMAAFWGTGELVFPVLHVYGWFAARGLAWDNAYAKWYNSAGAKGVRPPDKVRRLQQIYEELSVAASPKEIHALCAELMRSHAGNLWTIPLTGPMIIPGVVKKDFRNVPLTGTASWIIYTPGNLNPETFFFKRESN